MSPQQKRSTQYDWFKGTAGKGKKKTPRESAKTVWKFVKIFIYLALFVFSMTGCIQTLIVRTSNDVGRGVEFYSSEGEVAPHVTTFALKTLKTTNTPVANIYTIDETDSNFWLSDETPESTADLKDIHTEVRTQNADGDLKLQDSFKGTVETLRLTEDGAKANDKRVLREDPKDPTSKPFVFTSKSTTTNLEADLSSLPSFKVLTEEDAVLNKDGTVKTPAKSFVKELSFNAPNFIGDKNAKVDEQRFKYATAMLKRIATDPIYEKAFNQTTSVVTPGVFDPDADKVLTEQLQYQSRAIMKVLGYVGFYTDDKVLGGTDTLFPFDFKIGYMPGAGTSKSGTVAGSGSTNWRPIVTWGDAWGEGPFYGIFVYPVAWVSAVMVDAMPFMSGWEALLTIFIVVFSIRALTFALSFKATMQQTKMQELQSKKAVIDAKYAAYKGNKQMENRQKQEVAEMYKKEGVSMFGSISSIFLTMPFFLAIWRTIGGLPHIKSAVWLGINFSATSWKELFAGSFEYLPLMIVAAGFAAFQQIFPRLLTKRRDKNRINVHQKAAMKKSNKTQNIMMIVFVFMSIIFTAGLQVYWIAGGLWMTIQSYVTHRLFMREGKNKKRRKIKA